MIVIGIVIVYFLVIGYLKSIYNEINISVNSINYYLGVSYVKDGISSYFYKETITIGLLFFNVVFIFYKKR